MDQFQKPFVDHWDQLVGWEKRSALEIPFFLGLLDKFNCTSVLDVALGTGFHSIEFLKAKEGLRVKSVDVSPAMVEHANKNAEAHGVKLDAECANWTDLSRLVTEKFDCIVCLGNSLACEMDEAQRFLAVDNWSKCLSDNGIVIVDRRNYEALLSGAYNFGSKSPYSGETVKIEASKIAADGTVFTYRFTDGAAFTLDMYPLLDKDMDAMFSTAGLGVTELYGDREPHRKGNDVGFYTYVCGKVNNAQL